MKCVMCAKSLAWCSSNPLDLSNKSKNLCTYSCNVLEGFSCWSISIDAACCLVATRAKIVV